MAAPQRRRRRQRPHRLLPSSPIPIRTPPSPPLGTDRFAALADIRDTARPFRRHHPRRCPATDLQLEFASDCRLPPDRRGDGAGGRHQCHRRSRLSAPTRRAHPGVRLATPPRPGSTTAARASACRSSTRSTMRPSSPVGPAASAKSVTERELLQLPRHLLRGPARQLRRQAQDARPRHPRQTHHRLHLVARAARPHRRARRRPGVRLAGAQPLRSPPSGSAKSTTSGKWASPAAPADHGRTPP